jgi:hypothetical protein
MDMSLGSRRGTCSFGSFNCFLAPLGCALCRQVAPGAKEALPRPSPQPLDCRARPVPAQRGCRSLSDRLVLSQLHSRLSEIAEGTLLVPSSLSEKAYRKTRPSSWCCRSFESPEMKRYLRGCTGQVRGLRVNRKTRPLSNHVARTLLRQRARPDSIYLRIDFLPLAICYQ